MSSRINHIAVWVLLILCVYLYRGYAGYTRVNCVNIYLADNENETTVSVKDTWYTISGTWTAITLNEWTHENGVITSPAVGGAGHYYITWSALLTATAEDKFEVAVFVDGSRLEPPGKTEIGKTGSASVSGGHCLVISDGETMEMKVRNRTNTGNVTATHAAITLHKI